MKICPPCEPLPAKSLARIHALTNQRFGRLTVIRVVGRRIQLSSGGVIWECLCDCGNLSYHNTSVLIHHKSQSCGCYNKEQTSKAKKRHGKTGSPEYVAWQEARKRCNNPHMRCYTNYGGRGIEFRFDSFEEFYAELGDKPSPQHSLDRINNEGHYEKGNVQWATSQQQNSNKRNIHWITIGNECLSMSEWGRRNKLDVRIIDCRIRRQGWCESCAATLPTHQKLTCPHKEKSSP